ncbi:MAG: hypothetical protein LQ340_005047 [Diploschistes diacapsis]|nr:MAG: hypothetical protein LQ340_005047 [Diploschistes diacapsis]
MRSHATLQVEDDEEEDEETLQLRLQALEAKLKLKRLQNKKNKGNQPSSDVENAENDTTITTSRAATALSSRRDDNGASGLLRSKSTGNIQVPLSPQRKPTVLQEQRSPGRVLLGIDKGLSARQVSLRRVPTSADTGPFKEDPFGATVRPSVSRAQGRGSGTVLSRPDNTGLKSFNERIAESRDREQSEKERQERVIRLRAQKSKGFGVQEAQLEVFRAASEREAAATQEHASRRRRQGYSRDDVVNAFNKPIGGLVSRANSTLVRRDNRDDVPVVPDAPRQAPPPILRNLTAKRGQPRAGSGALSDDSRPSTLTDPALFEGFSHTNLSRRILPHSFLARTLEDKTPTTIPILLRGIVAPHFALPPELEEKDFVVFGTIASKSAPMDHKETRKAHTTKHSGPTSAEEAAASEANVNGKYMVFTLTDLKWTLDLYIFTTAYVRFRKLQPGTLIAILNPSIMPPPPGRADTNRWSLTLHSSDDTILEIGTSKDLGWCKATKKDGNPCNAWVDARKNDFCEFHIDRNIERTRRGRMEVQGMSAPFAPGGKGAGRHGFFGSTRRGRNERESQEDGLLKEGKQYDRSSRSTYFIAPHVANRTTANLLDADEDGGVHGNREERVRRALAEQEKERNIARKLGEGGNGTGAEYLRLHQESSTVATAKHFSTEVTVSRALDTGDLGLKSNRAGSVMLSPLKRKNSSARTAHHGNAVDNTGPQRKKIRFVTAKGIREAGRESIGGDAVGQGDIDLDVF